ncbi:phage distal tail protein [Ruminococcus champanellensis]|uniref:phage distal tail protein n=1 Tax=Ruminococcus champanellensis TaxID=1161942 RepID=UPI0039F4CF9A
MFFSLILENAAGDQINMTATANQYMTSQIEGLNPPPGTISTSGYAGMDGSYLNNAFIEKRNVVIHFEMRGMGVEIRRHQLYKVVKPSRYVKVYYRTAGIDVFTEGYVETCEVSNFEQLVTGQMSILCPDIYWYSTESVMTYYSQITGAFTFPFPTESNPEPFVLGKYNTQNIMEIINDGDEIGFTLVIEASSDEEVATRSPTLYNADTDEYLQITGEILAGDIITVTTKTGHKTVTLDRGGVKTNIINRLVSGSTWLTLREGRNRFYLRGTGLQNLKVTIVHTNAYLGV